MTDFGDDVGDILFRQAQRGVESLLNAYKNKQLRQYADPETGKTVNEFDFHSKEQRDAVLSQLQGESVPVQAVGETKMIFFQEDAVSVITALEKFRKQIAEELENPPIDINDKDYESMIAAQAAREEQQAAYEAFYQERGYEDAPKKAAGAVGGDKLSDAIRDNPKITNSVLDQMQAPNSSKAKTTTEKTGEFGKNTPRLDDMLKKMSAASARLAAEKKAHTREMQLEKHIPSR